MASARRGQERIVVSMFGGTSTAQRNARVTELMNMGFDRAPTRAAVVALPRIHLDGRYQVASVAPVSGLVETAVRPKARGTAVAVSMARDYDQEAQAAAIAAAIAAADIGTPISPGPVFVRPPSSPNPIAPPARRAEIGSSYALAAVQEEAAIPAPIRATAPDATGNYAVQVGAFRTRNQAERLLIQTALVDLDSFGDAIRSISPATVQGVSMFQARFVGMSQNSAEKACARLLALQSDCAIIAPQG